jgi:hypothetical protein
MTDQLHHVQRPVPPWREITLTECGLDLAGRPAMSRDEFLTLVQRLGHQRASMQTCMTCWSTVRRWPEWEVDPVKSIGREVSTHQNIAREGNHPSFRDELYAIAALIAAHRDEFDGYLDGLSQSTSLDAARKRRRAR